MPELKHYHTVLSIAGSDSIGGAGIQADIKTCTALGCYAMTAITAVTAQNTLGVLAFEPVSERLMRLQLKAVCSDVRPDAVKIGMVPTPEIANIIADAIEEYRLRNIVVDPVMVSTSGCGLSSSPAIAALAERVFPHAALITPNLAEGAALLGGRAPDAKELSRAVGGVAVLLKGGHLEDSDILTDILHFQSRDYEYSHPRLLTPNTHGTGCTLSSAIACALAQGMPLPQACGLAIQWLHKAIASGAGYAIGHGHGSVNHLHNIMQS